MCHDLSVWNARQKFAFAQSKRLPPKYNLPIRENNSLEQAAFWYRPPFFYTMKAQLNITDQSSIVCCCCCFLTLFLYYFCFCSFLVIKKNCPWTRSLTGGPWTRSKVGVHVLSSPAQVRSSSCQTNRKPLVYRTVTIFSVIFRCIQLQITYFLRQR